MFNVVIKLNIGFYVKFNKYLTQVTLIGIRVLGVFQKARLGE